MWRVVRSPLDGVIGVPPAALCALRALGLIVLVSACVAVRGFSKGWREAFMSGDQEPWIFRGGLTAELQRLIPVDASNDLFLYKAPDELLCKSFVIRPYFETDRADLYKLVLRTADDGKDATQLYETHADLAGDIFVGSFLRAKEDERIILVVEDDVGALVGYCCAAINARTHSQQHAHHLTLLRDQYPKVVREEGSMLTACEQLLATLWDEPPAFPVASPPTPPVAMSQGATPTPSVAPPSITSITPPDSETSSPPAPPSSSTTMTPPLPPTASPTDGDCSKLLPATATTNGSNATLDSSNLVSNHSSDASLPSLVTPAPVVTPVGDLLRYYPAVIRVSVLSSVTDESITKRLVTCLLASLRAKGGFGGHICLPSADKYCLELYGKLGFTQIGMVGDNIYMARSF